MMALQIHCSYTCYKHLCPPVGQAAGRVPLPQQSDGVPLLWWQRLSDPWAGILTHRASFLAVFFSCMLPPQALVSQRKMGMNLFTDRWRRNAMSSFSHKGSGRSPTAEALCCTSLLTAHQKYPNSYPVSPVLNNYSQNNIFSSFC